MNTTAVVVLIYGAFNIIGGIIGFVKAKSKASLIAGLLAGITLLFSAYGIAKGSNLFSYVVGVIALLLGARFFKTWTVRKKVMPDLIMVILSGVTLIFIILEVLQ